MFIREKKNFLIPLLCFLLIMVTAGLGCKQRGDESDEAIESPEAEPLVTEPSLPAPGATTPTSSPFVPPSTSSPQDLQTAKGAELEELARDFTEVWATFSSTTNCQNIQDLLTYMSEDFRGEMEDYLEEECSQSYTGPPFGWQTKALESVILDQDQDLATILVVTERRKSGLETQLYYPNLILELVVETDTQGREEWKVDKVYWTGSGSRE